MVKDKSIEGINKIQMDMKYIFKLEEIALDIFNALNINTEKPINIKEIVDILGGSIKEHNQLEYRLEKYDLRKTQDSFDINLLYNIDKHRKTMLTAKAVGILILKGRYRISQDIWDTFRVDESLSVWIDPTIEKHSFVLGLCLLMPKEHFIHKLKESYKGDGLYDLSKVARYFNVSEEMVRNRGVLLRMIEHPKEGIKYI